MLSIFFDLETSDTSFIGQILNYSFITVDENFDYVSELSGKIKINRLQLPAPRAILANRIDVLEHQKTSSDTERVAAKKISDYLVSVLAQAQSNVKLIGFNSVKFDIPYLRTTLLRNGVSPYFRLESGGPGAPKAVNADLLHLARKLCIANEEFAAMTLRLVPETGETKRMLTLQNLTQQFGLLEGGQSHESREDVLLTIKLAKAIRDRFGVDIRRFESYEGKRFHQGVRSGEVVIMKSPEYDTSLGRSTSLTPVTLLDFANSSALWIDLIRYDAGAGRESILWRNPNDGVLFVEAADSEMQSEYGALALQAITEFRDIGCANFFTRSICDIEADIYRLDFGANDAIRDALWADDISRAKKLSNPDVQRILTRHKMVAYEWGAGQDERMLAMLKDYGLYRYGGKAIIQKQYKGDSESGDLSHMHTTFSELQSDLTALLECGSDADIALLKSLNIFYKESDIIKAVGDEFSR